MEKFRFYGCGYEMSGNKKRRISSDVVLVVIGVASILSLQQCDSDDNCRYVYRSLHEKLIERWGMLRSQDRFNSLLHFISMHSNQEDFLTV